MARQLPRDIRARRRDQAAPKVRLSRAARRHCRGDYPKGDSRIILSRREYAILNLSDLEMLGDIAVITPEVLLERRIVKTPKDGIKVLGGGTLGKAVTIRAHAFSAVGC